MLIWHLYHKTCKIWQNHGRGTVLREYTLFAKFYAFYAKMEGRKCIRFYWQKVK